jgi:hypothetical protein
MELHGMLININLNSEADQPAQASRFFNVASGKGKTQK